jgi:DNA repair protein RecO (recombination protein O)
MDWRAEGIVIGVRRHGESDSIVELVTADYGRHLGLVHGGMSRRKRGILQPGNGVAAVWRARLSEHLGSYQVELKEERAGRVLDFPLRLNGLLSACTLLSAVLPERQAHRSLYEAFVVLLDRISGGEDDIWPALYVRYELGLLSELGFGLDLSACAATGAQDGLIYVSPRSGRAVSEAAGAPYRDKLLPLPFFLRARDDGNGLDQDIHPDMTSIGQGLQLTGYFLERHLLLPQGGKLPEERSRFMARIASAAQNMGAGS